MIHRSTKIIAVLSLLFFAACAATAFIFVDRVYAEKAVYAEKRDARATFLMREKSLSELEQALRATEAARASLESRILPDDVISFLALVEALGREQRVELVTSALTVQPVNSTFEELLMSIQIKGTYASVIHTITLFEHLPYQSSLGNLNLSKESEGDDSWRASFDIKVIKFKKV